MTENYPSAATVGVKKRCCPFGNNIYRTFRQSIIRQFICSLSYIVVEKGKIYPYAETGNTPFNPLSLPCSVVLRGIAHKIEVEAKEEYISTSPPVFR